MKSKEYRRIIKVITINILRKRFPGLKRLNADEAALEIARNIHARMYGANVDNVDSPLWRDWKTGINQHTDEGFGKISQPVTNAKELLNEAD